MNIIEKIIKRMKTEKGENGLYKVLESLYKDCLEKKDYATYEIIGFLLGLEYSGTITEKESEEATIYIINIK